MMITLVLSVVDRYVILGNHRDSWNFGAVDASSGTAAMMEAARVMGSMVTNKSRSHLIAYLSKYLR